MTNGRRKKLRFAQLVLGEAELKRFTVDGVLAALDLAAAAGIDAVIFWPARDESVDAPVRGRIRELGLASYLWLPVLADAGKDPAEGEWTENAWGASGQGTLGRWDGLGKGGETFLFACPRAENQLSAAVARCDRELPGYDGVFLDRIRYPSPANGPEMLFTCFCPRCRERDPGSGPWRERLREFRAGLESATDGGLERWGSLHGAWEAMRLGPWLDRRSGVIVEAVNRLAAVAMAMGKKVGLDLFSPALSRLVGQDYRRLGAMADWIKPMMYFRARGPAGIALEAACLARWIAGLNRSLSGQAVMRFVGNTLGLPVPPGSPGELEKTGLDEGLAEGELLRARKDAGCPVYPGFECVRHPDFDFDIGEDGVKRYLRALAKAPGVVMAWNILYTPEPFLKLVAEGA